MDTDYRLYAAGAVLHLVPFVLGFAVGRFDTRIHEKRTPLSRVCQAFTLLLFAWIALSFVFPKSFFTIVYEVLLIIEMLSFGLFYASFAAIAYFAGRAAGRDYV